MTSPGKRQQQGFTLVEIMIAVMVVGILAGIAAPYYLKDIRKAKEADCLANRQGLERAAIFHYTQKTLKAEDPIPPIPVMAALQRFDTIPQCPSGGVYQWARPTYDMTRSPELLCSIHHISPAQQ